jgi:hypothetical protein
VALTVAPSRDGVPYMPSPSWIRMKIGKWSGV